MQASQANFSPSLTIMAVIALIVILFRGCICVCIYSFVESKFNVDSDRLRLGRHRLGEQADVVEDCREGMTI